jgi:anaerobic magnesium-protoporphyrin IX monomethyl ester cyclase
VQPIRPSGKVVHIVPPLGLGYLASAIRDKHEVSILDCVKEKMSYDGFARHLQEVKPDVVGITSYSNTLSPVKKMLEVTRRFNQKITTVVGGPHPSGVVEKIFDHLPEADFAFRGESEIGFPLLLDYVADDIGAKNGVGKKAFLKEIPGLIYRNDNEVVANQPAFIEDLDKLGWPAWDLIKPDTYPLAPHGIYTKNTPIASVIVSRGCPFPCTFCAGSRVTGKKLRFRSMADVVREIEFLKQQYGVKEIHILDDNFTFKTEHVREFCHLVIEKGLNLSFSCPNGVRLDALDKETLILMKKAGWYLVTVGVESGSQRILNAMKKGLTLEKIKEQVSLIKNVGLETYGFFMIGYPGETKEDIEATIRFAKELDLDWAFFGNFIPLPGTETYRQLAENGELASIDWDNLYVGGAVVYSPQGISPQELKKLQRQAFLQFYCRAEMMVNFISKLRVSNLKIMIKRAMFMLLPRKADNG